MALSDLTTLREEAQEAEDDECYEDALAVYERILQASSDDQHVLERKAHILATLRGDEEALAAIDTALAACDEESTTAWLLRHKSRVLWQLKRCDEAQEAVDSALHLEPDHPYALLTKCCVERDLGHPEASLAAAQRLAELEPEDYQAVLEHAGALYRLKRYEEAVPLYARGSVGRRESHSRVLDGAIAFGPWTTRRSSSSV